MVLLGCYSYLLLDITRVKKVKTEELAQRVKQDAFADQILFIIVYGVCSR